MENEEDLYFSFEDVLSQQKEESELSEMAIKEDTFVSSDDLPLQPKLEELSIEPIGQYDKFRTFIDFNKLDSEIEAGTPHGLNRHITNNYKSWKDKKLIIGVAGNTGTGKSSLINALRGLKADDIGAAKVGKTETTTTVKEYPYPGNDRIVLKDFPGVGSTTFPKKHYLEKTKLLHSNVVMIVSSGRFTEIDLWLAQKVIQKQRNVLFVRTKVDTDLNDSQHDYPGTFNEYVCLSEIREDTYKNIKPLKMNIQNIHDVIYLVSSRQKRYDFDRLVGTLKYLLNMENNAICQLLYEHMQKIIESKTRQTEKEFLGKKIAAAIVGFLPIPKLESTLDSHNVGEMIEDCQKRYCIDKESLKKLANELNTTEDKLKRMLESYDEETSDGERLHSVTEDKKWGFFRKYSKYFMPVVGSVLSSYKSPCTMQECLERICRVMAKDELMLVRLRLEKLRKDLMMLQE